MGVQRTARLAAYGARTEAGPGRHAGEGATPPVAGFHSRTVPPPLPVASSLPLGLNATTDPPPGCQTRTMPSVGPHAPWTGGENATGAGSGMRPPGTGTVAAADGEAVRWCGLVRAATTPTSNATTASPATAQTHLGGRGQPPNSITSCDVTS